MLKGNEVTQQIKIEILDSVCVLAFFVCSRIPHYLSTMKKPVFCGCFLMSSWASAEHVWSSAWQVKHLSLREALRTSANGPLT